MTNPRPQIGDVWVSKARRHERAPKGRVHVTDTQTVRDVPMVWVSYAESYGKGTSRKLLVGDFLTDYELVYREGMKPATPPPDEPGVENAHGLERVGRMDPAVAIPKGVADQKRHDAIFDVGFEQPTPADVAAATERKQQRAAKPKLADIAAAEKDLSF